MKLWDDIRPSEEMLDACDATVNASQLVGSHLFAPAAAGSDEAGLLLGSPLVEEVAC